MPTETEPMFEHVAAAIRSTAVAIGETMKPGAEWDRMMLGQAATGALFPPLCINEWFVSDDAREKFYRGLPHYVWDIDARMLAVVLPAWIATHEPNADGSPIDLADRPRAREHPDRREVVTVTVGTFGRVESWNADVLQTPAGPRLSGDWSHVVHPDGLYCGELVDAMRRAFA